MSADTTDIPTMVDAYIQWLKSKITLRPIDDWMEITTPFLDRHNDHLQIYIKPSGAGFILSDDGYTITDLKHSGCNLNSPKRQSILASTLAGFGITLANGCLEAAATKENFPMRKHSLVQAMLAVDDMFYLAESSVKSLFHEDVSLWLDKYDIRYSSNMKIAGKSGFDHKFDFVIPKSKIAPERLVQAINHPTKDKVKNLMFTWEDTQKVRAGDTRLYALLNDEKKATSDEVIFALNRYDIIPLSWSKREEFIPQLAS